MHQIRGSNLSRCLVRHLAPAISAVVTVIALTLPSGSVIAGKTPVNVVLHNTATGVVVGGITVSPNNESVYVAGWAPVAGLPSYLVVLHSSDASVSSYVPLTGQAGAGDVAVSRHGAKVFVSNFFSGTVSVVSTITNQVIATLQAGPLPVGVAVSPDGKEVWVANSGTAGNNNGTVMVFDTKTFQPISLINVGGSPRQVVFDKSGKTAFVLNQFQTGFMTVVEVARHDIINGNFGAGIVNNPYNLGGAILSDAGSVYVSNGFSTISNLSIQHGNQKNAIVVFPAVVPLGLQLLGQPVLTRDGKYLYVAAPALNQIGWATTGNDVAQQLSPISVSPGVAPYTLAVSPDDTRLYVGNIGNGVVTQIDITH